MSNLSEQEIKDIVAKTSETATEIRSTNTVVPPTTRDLLVIGFGDGGCNIASSVAKTVRDQAYVIAYNTSKRAMDKITANVKIIPDDEDGSGKARDYSKEVFKHGSYKHLLENAQAAIAKRDIQYAIVCTTADGGTGSGSSPMAANFLADNLTKKNGDPLPVIVLGVYPSLQEDAIAQFNSIQWQSEVLAADLPYMVFDNNVDSIKSIAHKKVNNYAAEVVSLIAGQLYGNTTISMIDNKDMETLLSRVGGRIVIATGTTRPTVGQTFDNYIENLLKSNNQPMPADVRGIGLFVKAPADVISHMDTSLSGLGAKYGEAAARYTHIEESDEVRISIIMAGCTDPNDRVRTMRARYDDIMNNQKSRVSAVNEMLDDMVNPLMGDNKRHHTSGETDLSALDL